MSSAEPNMAEGPFKFFIIIIIIIMIIIIIILIIIYLTANGLSPGGSGYNACT